jgi:hypothetical protein
VHVKIIEEGSPAGSCRAWRCWPRCSTSRPVPARCATPASPGSWEELKVRATLDLLQERGSRPAAAAAPAAGPGIGANITITVPHTALGGDWGPPGEVAGFGTIDHADTRDLIAAAARHPGDPVVRDRAAPRRDRGRARLRRRDPPAGPGAPAPARPAGLPDHHRTHPGHPRAVPARRRRGALPAQPRAPAPGPGPQRDLHRAGLRPPRRQLRPGPTPPPTTTAAGPANATWPRYAGTTTAASKPRTGGWNNPNPASWSGTPPPAAPTPPPPPNTPPDRTF